MTDAASNCFDKPLQTIDIFTDGGYLERHNIGGWSWVIYRNQIECSRAHGSKQTTTSLEMELTAAQQALEYTRDRNLENSGLDKSQTHRIIVHTDCRIIIEGLHIKYPTWCADNWKVKSGKSVVFKELWQQVYTLSAQQGVEWKWVKSHRHSEGNNLADKLAREAVKERLKPN